MSSPEQPIGDFPPGDVHQTIAQRFEQQALRHAARLAIKTPAQTLTYEELNRAANRIAHAIVARAGKTSTPIALLFRGGASMIAAGLGVLKAAKAYAPIDAQLPPAKARQILTELQSSLLLTDGENLAASRSIAGRSREILNIDALAPSLPTENLGLSAAAEAIAYINFTSGTTGKPKGVVWNHRNELFGIRTKAHALGISAADRVSLLRANSVGAARDMHLGLLNGAAVVTLDSQEGGLASLASWLRDEEISVFSCVATVFRHAVESARGAADFAKIRLVHIGGEPILKSDVELYQRYFPDDCRFVSRYSLSETQAVSYFFIDKKTELTEERVPVGYALDGSEVSIIDDKGKEVDAGETGEIVIKSPYLALGYWRQPKLTRARFAAAATRPGVRSYRTGDLGYCLADGCLVHVGRKDLQVKIRGHRVELTAIETALHGFDSVKQAVVIAAERGRRDKRLIAYLVPRRGGERSIKELRAKLRTRLPAPMIPSEFVFLDRLPMSSGGKIDRRALTAFAVRRRNFDQPVAAPRGALERLLLQVWREALEVETLGIHDDFAELGGDSLLGARIVARVSKFFPLAAPAANLFQTPTVAQLADWMIAHEAQPGQAERIAVLLLRIGTMSEADIFAALEGGEKKRTAIERRSEVARLDLDAAKRELLEKLMRRDGIDLPGDDRIAASAAPEVSLSLAQERLWFLEKLEPGGAVYHIARAMRLRGRLDHDALVSAFNEIARRHQILRATFHATSAGPVSRTSPELNLEIPLIDLSKLTHSRRRSRLAHALSAAASAPFDLTRGPLLRLRLIKLGADDHVLLLATHQIICDGVSMQLIFRELQTLCRARDRCRPGLLPALPIQYSDFAAWQRQSVGGDGMNKQLGYWKARLRDNLPGLDLPTDRPRPARQTFRGARRSLAVPGDVIRGLKKLGNAEGATLFAMLIAAFNVLLWRYSNQDDICVGFPSAQRSRAETRDLIGAFVNTLVLRTDLSGNPTFRELLRRMREHIDGALVHQDLPFDKLVDELAPKRDLSRNPLFQAMFAYQSDPAAALDLPGLKSAPVEIESATSKFDLTLSLTARAKDLRGFIEYSSDLFDGQTIERMARHFLTLLRAIVANPDRAIGALPLLDSAERKRVLVEWNDTATRLSKTQCLHELFEAQARRTPRATAVQCGTSTLTYRQLDHRANQLARHLRELGVGREKLVGVCAARSLELVIGLLGILKAGGAYVPLDPGYPRERIEFMLEDAGIQVLLTDKEWVSGVSGQVLERKLKTVRLDREWATIRRQSPAVLPPVSRPRHLAYVIYTSGSTGQPKGVAIEHQSAVAFLHWAKTVFTRRDMAGVLASTSICFDLSLFELFAPLSRGGKVILVEDALALGDSPPGGQITLINTVPSVLRELLGAGRLPPSVRTVNLAGEPVDAELVRRIYQNRPVQKVYDLYGPSETTTYSTFALRTADGRETIGRPIANTRIYLLDEHRQPVPVGVPGELYIGGAGVARGYWRRPELTAERFLRDPFAGSAGARIYRTGDRARYLPDGNIEYLGRADNQVKIRGFRIEPGEIETALRRHPAVRECVVIATDGEWSDSDNPKSKIQNQKPGLSLTAHVIPLHVPPLVDDLKEFLRRTLPDFMVPSAFVFLDALPRTPNGKVDRRALPAPASDRPKLKIEFVAPRTEVEELIALEWRAALKVERVGVHDNFFELGGHSLLAMRVVGRLCGAFNVELPLRKLFEAPTVSGLAAQIEELQRNRSGTHGARMVAVDRERIIPLSFAQRGLWFLHKLDPGLTAYNMPAAYRIRGLLSVPALQAALDGMIRRHESLRTAIVEIDGEPAQRVLPVAPLPLPLIDLSATSMREGEAEAAYQIAADAQMPFALDQAPLMRAQLFRLGDRDHIVYLNFHHIIADGTSMAIFFRELASLYDASLTRATAGLPELPVQYADFAVWQSETLRDGGFDAQRSYWSRQLAGGLRPLDLPADFERPAIQTYQGAKRAKRLSRTLTASIKDLSRRQGATPFMTLLATLVLLLSRLSGEDDIVIGSTVAGRTRPEVEGVFGFFINVLALRCDLAGKPSFVELLKRVREVCLDAYTHQDVPFDSVVEAVQPPCGGARNPIFQVLFNMMEVSGRGLSLTGCHIEKISLTTPGAKFDIVVQAPVLDDCIELVMVYNADLFSEARIAAMLDQFELLLSAICGDPERSVEWYSLLTPAARTLLPDPTEKLDDGWRGALHEVVARQAADRPRAIAVVDESESWRYEEIEHYSGRFANALRAHGIEPGDVVAIYARRCAVLAPVLLGVLKAGAVFAILDPTYPKGRLADYIDIAQPRAWLEIGRGVEADDKLDVVAGSLLRWRVSVPNGKAELARLLEPYATSTPSISIDADTPSYIAFTSGSTGRPKGVLGRHGPMTYFLPWQQAEFGLTENERYALLSGLAYNHLHRDLFTALASGATLFVPTAECLKEPKLLFDWLCEREIAVLHLTPALGRLLTTINGALPALRRIFIGGDVLRREDARALRELAPNAAIVSLYGATETQRAIGYFKIADDLVKNDRAKAMLPTGRGAPGVQLLLLRDDLQLAGIGEVGELYIRSPHLAAKYVNDDALTAANFIFNPFTGDRRDPLYRTGDKGRYLPDGNVAWAGRTDRCVNIRGFRIELAEVEAVLSRCPGVRNAAVLAREFSADDGAANDDISVTAYVEVTAPAAVRGGELRRFTDANLPHYMVPAYFKIIDRLPLNPNGKVDYAALPVLDPHEPEQDASIDSPRNDLERNLAKVFCHVLRIASVDRRDNFFDLGGHSLLAAQAAARIRAATGVKLDLRSFLETPTVAGLAARIEATGDPPLAGSLSPAEEREEIEL